MITVSITVDVPIEKAWEIWTTPEHITKWNNATDDWHTPHAEVDLQTGGSFLSRMESKDGAHGFDFRGMYTEVIPFEKIAYVLEDGREVNISFSARENGTTITESFTPENKNTLELQQQGWQAIMDNFKKYAESNQSCKTLNYSITINAPASKVYTNMLSEDGYKQWTAVFNAASLFIGSWEKGARIQFLGCDANGKVGGMISRIAENIPNEFVSIEHMGKVQNGEAITNGAEVESWAGAHENYRFTEIDDKTTVTVFLDTAFGYDDYFNNTYPNALQKLKEICEE